MHQSSTAQHDSVRRTCCGKQDIKVALRIFVMSAGCLLLVKQLTGTIEAVRLS